MDLLTSSREEPCNAVSGAILSQKRSCMALKVLGVYVEAQRKAETRLSAQCACFCLCYWMAAQWPRQVFCPWRGNILSPKCTTRREMFSPSAIQGIPTPHCPLHPPFLQEHQCCLAWLWGMSWTSKTSWISLFVKTCDSSFGFSRQCFLGECLYCVNLVSTVPPLLSFSPCPLSAKRSPSTLWPCGFSLP